MQYKTLLISLIATVLLSSTLVYQASASDIEVERAEKLENTKTFTSPSSREYQSFSSCDDFEDVVWDFIEENKELWNRWYPIMYATDDMMFEEAEMADEAIAAPQAVSARASGWSNEKSFSTTNLQVGGVDEPEIIKTDGEYIYYYSAQLGKITIVEYGNGLDGGALEDAISSIQVPKTLSNIQLFLQDDTLTVLWNRRSQASGKGLLDNGQKTTVSVFDMKNPSDPKLNAFHDLDGYMTDSRMIDGELTVITSLGVNRRQLGQSEEVPEVSTLRPTQRSVLYKTDASLDINWKSYPYELTSTTADCDSIQYLFPTAETLKQQQSYPSFTTVYTIDTTEKTEAEVTTLFWNVDQIHMSQKNLYMTAWQRLPSGSSCPINARCLFPSFGSQQTLIHKYELDDMEYDGSAMIDGAPLPQRSMSESSDEEFRILTRTRNPTQATHLTILDNDLDLEWSLLNIEPWEEFKASRYIWNKLYLVTFEQIDPLFVIDLEDSSEPEILGELKIPGYSTYLHPYGTLQDWIQHLIGLWYDTTTNQRWWTQTAGVKVDLYTVDYNISPISIKQTHTLTMWDQDSRTEVAENPRQFVWNPQTSTLLLPVVLTEAVKGSNCQVFYDANGQEEGRTCNEQVRTSTSFAWLKQVQIDLEDGITQESLIDLKPLLSEFKNLNNDRYDYEEDFWEMSEISPRMIRNLMMRTWFIDDETYLFTNQSVTFSNGESEESALLK